jgi:uncharacterized protein (TIGR02246 family)
MIISRKARGETNFTRENSFLQPERGIGMTRKHAWTGLVVLVTFSLTSCTQPAQAPQTPAPPPDTRAADEKAIRDIEAQWVKDFQAKDLDKETSVYAPDGSFLMTGAPIQTGKDAIRATHKAFLEDPNFAVDFSPSRVVVARSSDVAYAQGAYTFTFSDPKTKKPVTEKGKYVDVYQKQPDGSWKVVEDIFNADAPAEPARK